MSRRDMIQRLVRIQNTPRAVNQDILTITGFMSDEQVAAHLARYEAYELDRIHTLTSPKETPRG